MAATWDEIRQLQADLASVQKAESSQKLSERNCVEIVNHLIAIDLLEVLFTLDGKEYVTPQRLEREIRDELYVHGGRINVVELQSILNIDLGLIEVRVVELVKRETSLHAVHGELISEGYLSKMADEVNDMLQSAGRVVVAELSRQFNLPMDFLVEVVESRMGHGISGRLERSDQLVIYTEAYMSRYRSQVRGLFNAATCPTAVARVIERGDFQEKLFLSVLSDLVASGEVSGVLHGRADRAVFTPHIYSRAQNSWVDAFYSANDYLEYDSLSRLGLEDPKGYAKCRFGERKDTVLLDSCLLGPSHLSQVESALEDTQNSETWVDVQPLLPSPCSLQDGELLLQKYSKSFPKLTMVGTVACAKGFMRKCIDLFRPAMKEKAKRDLVSNQKFLLQLSSSPDHHPQLAASLPEERGREGRREERRKKAAGMGAATSKPGAHGREKKTQKVKGGKGRAHGGREDEEEREERTLLFMTTEEILDALTKQYSDAPEDFLEIIAADLNLPLKAAYQEEARAALEQMRDQSRQRKRGAKEHASLQESVQEMWTTAVLFAKTIPLFEGFPKEPLSYQTWDNTVVHLSKHLLKTLCTDLANTLVRAVAQDHLLDTPPEEGGQMTSETRLDVIKQLPEPAKAYLFDLHHSLAVKSTGDFFGRFEAAAVQDFAGLQLKRPDRKKERLVVHSHCLSLADQLRNEADPAMALHLATVLIFMKVTGCLLHLPGRLVPQVIAYLQDKHVKDVPREDLLLLRAYQELLVASMKESRERERQHSESQVMTGDVVAENKAQTEGGPGAEGERDREEGQSKAQLVERLHGVKQVALKYVAQGGRGGQLTEANEP